MKTFLRKCLTRNRSGPYNIREDVLKEEGISYAKEKDLLYLFCGQNTIAIPVTNTGLKILKYTQDFIENLLDSEEEITEYLSRLQSKHLEKVIEVYKSLALEWIGNEDILIYTSLKKYKLNTKNKFYNLVKLEVFLNLLDYAVEKEELKQLTSEEFDAIPIVFPIKQNTTLSSICSNEIDDKILFNLIFKGQEKGDEY